MRKRLEPGIWCFGPAGCPADLFFVNLERFTVRTSAGIKAIEKAAEAKFAPLGKRVYESADEARWDAQESGER